MKKIDHSIVRRGDHPLIMIAAYMNLACSTVLFDLIILQALGVTIYFHLRNSAK